MQLSHYGSKYNSKNTKHAYSCTENYSMSHLYSSKTAARALIHDFIHKLTHSFFFFRPLQLLKSAIIFPGD